MTKTSIYDIKQELLVFLRNLDIISTTDRGVSTHQDTGTFSSSTTYTISTTPTLLKNIRTIVIDGTTLSFGDDYLVDYDTGEITFNNSMTGDYSIEYDVGTSDRIYPDYPQPYLNQSSFPRIGFDLISGSTKEFGIGANVSESEYIISITFYDKSQKNVEKGIALIRTSLLDNKKNFFYIPFLTVTTMGPLLISPFGKNKIAQRNQDIMVRFIFEQ